MASPSSIAAKGKRRYPGNMISFHAFLLLLACTYGNTPVKALIAPSSPGSHTNHWLQSRRVQQQPTSSSLWSSVMKNEPTTKIKGQQTTAPSTQPKRRKRPKQKQKQKSSRKGGNSNRNNNNNSKSRIIQRSAAPSEPWNANYDTSRRTQKKIQSAAYKSKGSSNISPTRAAHAVLETLLKSPPEECNAANVVCALTLSSKTINQRRRGPRVQPPKEESEAFQKSLLRTLSILQFLVGERKLSPRQLCNAAWGIAKHVEHDQSLFSRKRDNFVLVRDGSKSYSTWDLREQQMLEDEDSGDSDKLIDEVLNLIALRVIEHLEETRANGYGSAKHQHIVGGKPVQPGELSMLLWSYAVAKPRDCPPGWEQPRKMEKLTSKDDSKKKNAEEDLDFVTFVELEDDAMSGGSLGQSSFEEHEEEDAKDENVSITGQLFDAAAIAFCQGEGAAVSGSNKKGEQTKKTLLKECTWSELSNIAWSYATRGAYVSEEGEAMMTFFAREATRRIRYCRRSSSFGERDDACNILPRDAIQIAWALGTMESDNVSVGDALVHLVDAVNGHWIEDQGWRKEGEEGRQQLPLARWTCADLVQMATALAHGRLDNPSVLKAVYDESLARLQNPKQRAFTTAEISILLWVQARLYLTPKFGNVYGAFPSVASGALLHRMEGRHNTINDNACPKATEEGQLFPAKIMHQKGLRPQEQANLAWSLTVLENYDSDVISLLQNIFHAASSSSNNNEGIIQLEHAHQLWQSYFLLSKDCPAAVQYVPSDFADYLEEKWNIEKSRSKQSSSRHRAISNTLSLMRVAHRNEYDEDVDVAIVLDEDSAWTHMALEDEFEFAAANAKKVAVEFDGPHHFTVMASTANDLLLMESGAKLKPRVLGHTVLKYRLLKKKGWTVVRIPYYEFDKVPVWASMERQRYLQRALRTHDKIEFSGIDVSEYQPMPETRHSRFD